MTDLIEKANFFTDIRPGSRFTDKKAELVRENGEATVDLRGRMYFRYAVQQIVLQCMATVGVDVLVYPTGNIPPPLLGAPTEPNKNGRSHLAWTLLGQQGYRDDRASRVYDACVRPRSGSSAHRRHASRRPSARGASSRH